uniref:Homing endonuclease n=1 Tax=viral metagenome TaxID=1070528 RepID=A0A6M3K5F2_9ZZZZ
MKETEKAYLAGLMDGEGSICILNWIPKETGRPRIMPMVKIGMHSKEAVDFFAQATGKNVYHQPGAKGTWSTQLTHKDAVDFLEEIMPYLITKKMQAGFFTFFYKIAFAVNYRGGISGLPLEIVKLRSLGAEIMHLLNKRDAMTFHGKADEFSGQLSPLMQDLKDMLTLSQASEGEGSEEGATTTEVSPNNNPLHESPPLTH